MKYFYLYQITNTLNGKIYIGVHQTKNLNDGYMGSGKLIRAAIIKYGTGAFVKEIIKFFDNEKDMYEYEHEIVNPLFLERGDVYNICEGGNGGFSHLNDSSDEHITRAKLGYQQSLAKRDLSAQSKAAAEKLKREKRGIFADGYTHPWKKDPTLQRLVQQMGNSPLSREKAKASQKSTFAKIKHQQGSKNSQYGSCWISHELFGSRKCNKELLPLFIEQGWIKGRNLFKSR